MVVQFNGSVVVTAPLGRVMTSGLPWGSCAMVVVRFNGSICFVTRPIASVSNVVVCPLASLNVA